MNRKFKHKKTGDVVTQHANGDYSINNMLCLSKQIIENSNDWEEITEPKKDYEILSVINSVGAISNSEYVINLPNLGKPNYMWNIHSIKRLSDNTVFTIGDMINHFDDSKHTGIISKFLVESYGIVAKFVGRYRGIDNHIFSNTIRVIEHTKKRLFRTEDGVDVYEGDLIWSVNSMFTLLHHKPNKNGYDKLYTGEKSLHLFNDYKTERKYFSTKEAAEEYILMNKPCISLEDILKALRDNNEYITESVYNKLEELVKSKL